MKILKELCEFAKNMHNSFFQQIYSWSEVVSIENDVRKLSNSTFIDAFKPVAHEISEITGIPYLTYLNKAKEMLLQGVGMQDTMYYFDSIWCDLKFKKPDCGVRKD